MNSHDTRVTRVVGPIQTVGVRRPDKNRAGINRNLLSAVSKILPESG